MLFLPCLSVLPPPPSLHLLSPPQSCFSSWLRPTFVNKTKKISVLFGLFEVNSIWRCSLAARPQTFLTWPSCLPFCVLRYSCGWTSYCQKLLGNPKFPKLRIHPKKAPTRTHRVFLGSSLNELPPATGLCFFKKVSQTFPPEV